MSTGSDTRSRRCCLATLGAGWVSCGPESNPESSPAFEVVETTIAEVQAAIRDGATTCRTVVERHLARIAAYEDLINAITVLNPRALERADALDASLAAGEAPGPLFCVPMLVKDNFDTHDMVTTGGSIALADNLPPDDAFMVRKIREAGAIIIAKTNMAEWAFSPRQSVSSSFDTTRRNAYALDRVPAGSSGGTASGVAAGFGLIGLGSDTGNSIRGPSSAPRPGGHPIHDRPHEPGRRDPPLLRPGHRRSDGPISGGCRARVWGRGRLRPRRPVH